MGVDYFPCAGCGQTICDAGDFNICEACGEYFCLDCDWGVDPGEIDGAPGYLSCILCTDDYTVRKIRHSELIPFLLTFTPFTTEEEAIAALRQHHQNTGTKINQPVANSPGLHVVMQ